MIKKIYGSINKFGLNLSGKTVLTEAATGNYVITPIIAALSGAMVYAFTKDSRYGSIDEVRKQTYILAKETGVDGKIKVLDSLDDINLKEIDVLTNTGFLRPINRILISRLSSRCVIPLMWEPWEHRSDELEIEVCREYGIKVYGTNESDQRLRTMEYIGFTVLYKLLENGMSPFSSNVLLIGCEQFIEPVERILRQNGYQLSKITDYVFNVNLEGFDVIVLLEHERDILIIGGDKSFIDKGDISDETLVLHICGRVDFNGALFRYIPKEPASYGYMSFTTDYIDNKAVIDLHTAGLSVAEGMLKANELGLKGIEYKTYMEGNYPAKAFDDPLLW